MIRFLAGAWIFSLAVLNMFMSPLRMLWQYYFPPPPSVGSYWIMKDDSHIIVRVFSSSKREVRYHFIPHRSVTSSLSTKAFREIYRHYPFGYYDNDEDEDNPF